MSLDLYRLSVSGSKISKTDFIIFSPSQFQLQPFYSELMADLASYLLRLKTSSTPP